MDLVQISATKLRLIGDVRARSFRATLASAMVYPVSQESLMPFQSPPYWHPGIYRLSEFPRRGRRAVRERIRAVIGPNQRVFDAAALFGELRGSLEPSCAYQGVDAVANLVRHAQRRGLDVRLEDPASDSRFPQSDAVVLIDRLHHVTRPQAQRILDKALQAAPLVLVVEPTFLQWTQLKGIGWFFDWFFRALDSNGYNKGFIWYTKAQYLQEFPQLFGLDRRDFTVDVSEVGSNLLAVYRQR